MTPTIQTTPPTESSTTKVLKVVGIVLLAGVALCGLSGTCLLIVYMVFSTSAGH